MDLANLLNIVYKLHTEAYELSKIVFGKQFKNSGNIGIFCQDDEQYKRLTKLKNQIIITDTNPKRKYFELKESIIIDNTTYSHLYIRKPDPSLYGKFLGDIDFYTDDKEFDNLKEKVKNGELTGAKIYHQTGVGDLIELSKKDIKTVAYLSTKEITENIRYTH